MNADTLFTGRKPLILIVGVMLILNIILTFIPIRLRILVEICGVRIFASFLIGCLVTTAVEEVLRFKENQP